MTRYRSFAPHDVLPSTYPDALGDFLGSATHNLRLLIKPGSPTTLQIPAGTDNDQVAAAINGRWRFITSTIERASPGGAAQTFDVYLTASDNSFGSATDDVGPYEVDNTDYSFAMMIVSSGSTPSGVDLSRKIASALWTGSMFLAVQRLDAPPTEQSFQPGDLIVSRAATRAGALLCDASSYVLSSHPELSILAGACPDLVSSGVLTVPDFRGRTIVGAGSGGSYTDLTTGAIKPLTERAAGDKGGEEKHTQAVAELVSHAHPFSGGLDNVLGGKAGGSILTGEGDPGVGEGDIENAGGGQPFNVMPPFGVANVFIKW